MTSDAKPAPPDGAQETGPEPTDVPEVPAEGQEAPEEAAVPSPEDLVKEAEERYVRLYAEFENYKKRTARENEDFRKYANEGVLKEMLGVLDNFERAIAHAKEAEGAGDKLIEGVELIHKQLLDVLGRQGVTPIAALGAPFDPQVHQAVSQQETGEAEAGTVVDEVQRGFFFRERVLRPAMVVVAKAPGNDTGAG